MSIIVIDSIMGSGKTQWAIQEMNRHIETNYIYCTPYTNECDRITNACPRFVQPEDNEIVKTKTGDLIQLIRESKSVAITHALLKVQDLSSVFTRIIQDKNYTLVLDESLSIVDKIDITQHDFSYLNDLGVISTDETGIVQWNVQNYTGRYEEYKRFINKQRVIMQNNQLLSLFPIELLNSFDQIIILTWMFEGSPMERYLKIHHMEYELFHIENGNIEPGEENLDSWKELINPNISIYHGKLNNIGFDKSTPIHDVCPLSATWWKATRNKPQRLQALRNVDNLVRNSRTKLGCAYTSADLIWTCYENSLFSGNRGPSINGRYADGFCPCNMRATNVYGDRTLFACLININADPSIAKWFSDNGQPLDKDRYAFTQLMQLLWRSAIRNGQRVVIYLPSQRMRYMLCSWLGRLDEFNEEYKQYFGDNPPSSVFTEEIISRPA